MKKINNQAFTLVELLIVVAILAVLATVGFVSYSNYLTGVRDTNRVTQLVGIRNAIETFKTTKDTPLPEEKIDIKVNGELIAYQGIVGQNILNQIGLSDGGTDPKDETYFPYYLTRDRKYFQLMTFLEDEPDKEEELTFFPQTYASTDYSIRYPKVIGFPLGILTEKDTNTPLHEIKALTGTLDVMTASGEYIAHIQEKNTVSGTGGKLLIGSVSTIVGTKYKSCKQILEKKPISSGVDGVYTINPTGLESFQVYCNMTTDGGGWTLVMVSDFYNFSNDNFIGTEEICTSYDCNTKGTSSFFANNGNYNGLIIPIKDYLFIGDLGGDLENPSTIYILNNAGDYDRGQGVTASLYEMLTDERKGTTAIGETVGSTNSISYSGWWWEGNYHDIIGEESLQVSCWGHHHYRIPTTGEPTESSAFYHYSYRLNEGNKCNSNSSWTEEEKQTAQWAILVR